MSKVLLINGPNLNLLGVRETALYGKFTLADVEGAVTALGKDLGAQVTCFQSNHEGAILDRLHEARGAADGVVINPGPMTHTSLALRDAIVGIGLPAVEVHITNIHAREEFRRRSYISDIALGTIAGFGIDSYLLGLRALVAHLARAPEQPHGR